MTWKHYIAGIATALAVGGSAYWSSQTNKTVGEKCIYTMGSEAGLAVIEKIKVIKEDRKWTFQDTYRIEFLNENGEMELYIRGLTNKPVPILEESVDSNNL